MEAIFQGFVYSMKETIPTKIQRKPAKKTHNLCGFLLFNLLSRKWEQHFCVPVIYLKFLSLFVQLYHQRSVSSMQLR